MKGFDWVLAKDFTISRQVTRKKFMKFISLVFKRSDIHWKLLMRTFICVIKTKLSFLRLKKAKLRRVIKRVVTFTRRIKYILNNIIIVIK